MYGSELNEATLLFIVLAPKMPLSILSIKFPYMGSSHWAYLILVAIDCCFQLDSSTPTGFLNFLSFSNNNLLLYSTLGSLLVFRYPEAMGTRSEYALSSTSSFLLAFASPLTSRLSSRGGRLLGSRRTVPLSTPLRPPIGDHRRWQQRHAQWR